MNHIERLNKEIVQYVESEIVPRYAAFDKAHNIDHAKAVISNSLEIASDYEVNIDMVYVIASFHDLGLEMDRKNHHIHSGKILLDDKILTGYFSHEQFIMMKEAIEDHRASNNHAPRSIYGMIVAEADRMIDYETILRRTIQFSLAHHSELNVEGHFERTVQHITEKYGQNGYLKLWLETRKNKEGLLSIQEKLENLERLKEDFLKIYSNEMREVKI